MFRRLLRLSLITIRFIIEGVEVIFFEDQEVTNYVMVANPPPEEVEICSYIDKLNASYEIPDEPPESIS